MNTVVGYIFLFVFAVLLVTTPIYILFKMVGSIYTGQRKLITKLIKIVNLDWVEVLYIFEIIGICILGLIFNSDGVKAGEPLTKYAIGGSFANGYASLASDNIAFIVLILVLGVLSYFILKLFSDNISPIIYVVASSMLILNIVFTILYFIHTSVDYNIASGDAEDTVLLIRLGFGAFSLLSCSEIITSMNKYMKKQQQNVKHYNNKVLNFLYTISIKYQTMPILWIITLFPIVIIIQLVLVLFGQQPDSFIQVFLDTSSFNYSAVNAPPPIVTEGDSHYLCTVSVKGHKKVVKPLRAGIRRNQRILVNRQLLVANAFENILEEYTPKLHRVIRYIYDKYGYPISKHINTSWSADIIYILMKPLEWIFTLILYTVDKNPENRINIQYSELR